MPTMTHSFIRIYTFRLGDPTSLRPAAERTTRWYARLV